VSARALSSLTYSPYSRYLCNTRNRELDMRGRYIQRQIHIQYPHSYDQARYAFSLSLVFKWSRYRFLTEPLHGQVLSGTISSTVNSNPCPPLPSPVFLEYKTKKSSLHNFTAIRIPTQVYLYIYRSPILFLKVYNLFDPHFQFNPRIPQSGYPPLSACFTESLLKDRTSSCLLRREKIIGHSIWKWAILWE